MVVADFVALVSLLIKKTMFVELHQRTATVAIDYF